MFGRKTDNELLVKRLNALENKAMELTGKNTILIELIRDLKMDILTLKTVVERINQQMALDAEKQAKNDQTNT